MPARAFFWRAAAFSPPSPFVRFKTNYARGENMNTNKINRMIATAVITSFAAFLLVGTVVAQGRWSARYTRTDVSSIIQRLEESSDRFRNDFDRALDNSNVDGTATERRYEQTVQDYENALDSLRSHFDRNDSWWESRSRVQMVITKARPVNSIMTSAAFRRNLEQQWNRMRGDLNTLADTYDLAGIGGGWTGGGGGGGGGWDGANNAPSWAVGTWYWNGGQARILTIANNGRVTVNSSGSMQNGWYSNGVITIGYEQSNITRNGNGIRTYNRVTGETSNYTRNSGGGGWNPGNPGNPGWDGGAQRPPNWAVGTWYWNGSRARILTVSANGQITVNSGGSVQYGTYNNGVIIIDGERSTLSRNGSRIRTYNQASGETSNYSQR